jgi:hypothetical protein
MRDARDQCSRSLPYVRARERELEKRLHDLVVREAIEVALQKAVAEALLAAVVVRLLIVHVRMSVSGPASKLAALHDPRFGAPSV